MSRYNVMSMEKISSPDGSVSKHWYKYIIANSYNTITSIRSGSEKEVRLFARETTIRLNEKYLTGCKVKSYNRPVNEANMSAFL